MYVIGCTTLVMQLLVEGQALQYHSQKFYSHDIYVGICRTKTLILTLPLTTF